MLLLYYTNTVLFWFGLPSFNPSEGLAKNLHKHDIDYLPREVCIAKCLERSKLSMPTSTVKSLIPRVIPKMPLELCVDYCAESNSADEQNSTAVKQIHENYSLSLICRDESSLNFQIHLHTAVKANSQTRNRTKETDVTTTNTLSSSSLTTMAPPTTAASLSDNGEVSHDEDTVVFVIKMHLANETDNFFVFLSDDNFFTINNLAPNTTYNISALAVHSSNRYSVIALEQQFQTLRRAYTPGNVTDIKVSDFLEDKDNRMHLSAVLTWKPPPDMTCHYDIICFSPESEDYDLQPLEIRNPRQLYKYQLENLTFSSVYKVGIRARNTKNMKESELFWKTFRAPTCVQWHNYNFNVCAPEAPQNLQIDQTFLEQNVYSLNISWNLPTYLPDNYTLYITDLSPQGQREMYNISRDMQNFFIDRIVIYGVWYEASLTATTVGGSATTAVTDVTKTIVHIPEKNQFVKVIAVIFALIFCVAILSMTIFIIYHRRAKLKRYQERCKYFEELEKKAPTDPKDNFDFMHTLGNSNSVNGNKLTADDLGYPLHTEEEATLFNDEMEINRNQLTLYEVLGEGAFGLVKRGVFKDLKRDASYDVAVKMLKDHPSADDIRAFRREIEVMKSVEKHPNIVGLIGHCTRFREDMMLLTEYCSFGNLLDFLRDEWKFLHEIQRRNHVFSSTTLDIELPRITEKGIQGLREFNLCTEDELPSPPPPPPPVALNRDESNGKSFKFNQIFEDLQKAKNNNNQENATTKDQIKREDSTSLSVIEKFKRKYNDVKSHNHNPSNGNGTKEGGDCLAPDQDIENIGTAAINTTLALSLSSASIPTCTSNRKTMSQLQSAVLTLGSPATENKSYGYDSCCTNSCKCSVDVIIKNIDSSDSSKEQEELDRLLLEKGGQEQHQPDVPKVPNKTIISIRNCDCHHQHQHRQCHPTHPRPHPPAHLQPQRHHHLTDNAEADVNHRLKSAVENKTYFKLFSSGEKHSNSHRQSSKATDATATTTTSPAPSVNDGTWPTTRIPLAAGDLLDIAQQVAVGMDFLAKNKVVHRDLAARNVLVAPDRTVKIADFGLSRDVYQENIYKKTGNGKLPIKWLALESLTHQVYTTQSDVWSYGILLYEIVTLGSTPYPSIPTNRLLHLLKTGYRMEKPKNCGEEFYGLMYSCWNSTPNERPTFSEIIAKLKGMHRELQISEQTSNSHHSSPQADASEEDNYARRRDEEDNEDELCKQESPIQQICNDDSYLKPL